jgi:hypothetical protein
MHTLIVASGDPFFDLGSGDPVDLDRVKILEIVTGMSLIDGPG